MHGTDVADGTDCATSTIKSVGPAFRLSVHVPSDRVAGRQQLDDLRTDEHEHRERCRAIRATRFTLHRCNAIGRRGGASSRNCREEVAAVFLHRGPQLRGARDAACGRERLGDLVGSEEPKRSLVHPFSVGANGEDEHHVRQVDCFTPRRRANLRERNVDDQHLAVAHEDVCRLDVAVSDTRIPHRPDQPEPAIDHGVVDVGFADLLAPSKNSVTRRYSRSGVSSTIPNGAAVRIPTSRNSRSV